MKRTFAMGDIHGNFVALKQCLDRSGFDKEKDTLIQLGDVADGWPQTPECVEELLSIKNLIPLRGNHDIWTWNWFTMGVQPVMWTQQGGRATIEAYISTGKISEPVHKDFWNSQLDYYIDDEKRLFVHAGFDLYNGFKWSKNAKVGIPNATELHWSRDLAEFNERSHGKIAISHLEEFTEIFIGHTSHNTTDFNGKGKRNIWNLDTGAGWNGRLTIMDVDTKEFWQSDKSKDLYPGIKGR